MLNIDLYDKYQKFSYYRFASCVQVQLNWIRRYTSIKLKIKYHVF